MFFIFDDGNVVVLFNGFHKKTRKTPESEIELAISQNLRKESTASNPATFRSIPREDDRFLSRLREEKGEQARFEVFEQRQIQKLEIS